MKPDSFAYRRSNSLRRGALHTGLCLSLGSLLAIAVLVSLLWSLGRRSHVDRTRQLVVYCAAGMIKPMEEIARDYETEYGVRIQLEPNGSKALLAKLSGFPDHGDLFLAADLETMQAAKKDGLVAETIPVAVQHPVVAIRQGFDREAIEKLSDLTTPGVRVALPNPGTASIGSVARKAAPKEWAELEKQISAFQDKVSYVGTVTEAANDVKIGAKDAAVVWDSTARQYDLDFVVPGEFRGVSDRVVLGVVARCPYPERALHFARYVTARDKGARQFTKAYCEQIADADVWADVPRIELMMGAMLQPAVEPTVRDFERREGAKITLIANGCGILVTQMKAGSRPGAYFSCDLKFMNDVQEWFEKPAIISENDLVMLVSKEKSKDINGLGDLTGNGVRVGLAVPEESALGGVTKGLLQRHRLYEKMIDGGNWRVRSPTGDYLVNQILAGPLDAVIVYRSNALASPETLEKVDLMEIDDGQARATQPFAIARDFEHKYLMQRLLDSIRSPRSRERFEKLGFHWKAGP